MALHGVGTPWDGCCFMMYGILCYTAVSWGVCYRPPCVAERVGRNAVLIGHSEITRHPPNLTRHTGMQAYTNTR